jgi:hypothetical protein
MDFDSVIWRTPLVTCSHLIAEVRRRNGGKVGRQLDYGFALREMRLQNVP